MVVSMKPKAEKFYHPLGIWAVKHRSKTEAAEYCRQGHNLFAFQWRGIGTFSTSQPPPETVKSIIVLHFDKEK